MNRRYYVLLAAGVIAAAVVTGPAQAASGPRYASPAAKETIAKMLAAHGGIEKWRACPTVSFDSHLKVHVGGGNWIDFWEEVTVDRNRRRVYADLPNPDGTRGHIAFDGEKAWSAGNLQGMAKAPARFTAWRNFYLFNIPWLTQDDGVILGEPGKGKIPNDDREYITVPMSFETGTGDTPKDDYTLFIDPDTYRLKASEYGMTYKSMMPEGVEMTPYSVMVWDNTATVDGIVVLTKYNVYWRKDGAKVVEGEVSNWSMSKPFDESRMLMPADGALDQSTP